MEREREREGERGWNEGIVGDGGGEPLPRSPPLPHTRLPLQLALCFLVKLCQLCLSLCMADCFLHIIHKNNYQSIRRKSMSKC